MLRGFLNLTRVCVAARDRVKIHDAVTRQLQNGGLILPLERLASLTPDFIRHGLN
jgi:hypothetical protein